MADQETIIIGGGHNGLICAIVLARAGQRVTVLEERCATHLRVGDKLTLERLNALPPEIDRFGENGEFHTAIRLGASSG